MTRTTATRPPALPGRVRLLMVLSAALTLAVGCGRSEGHGAIDPVTAFFGPGGPPIPTATGPQGRPVTSPAEAARVLLGQFPTSTTGIARTELVAARNVAIRVLSKLHGDPGWLCGTATGKDPVESEFPPGTRWVSDPKQDPFRKFHALYQLPGCDQARLSAVYVGDQQFSVGRDGSDVRVDHIGAFTYDTRALTNGVRLPVHVVAQRTLVLRKFPDGYHVWKLINTYTQAAPGYGKTLPVYTSTVPGLQLGNLLDSPDDAATAAVRSALAATVGAGSAKVSFADRSTAPWLLGQPGLRTGQFWPQAGSALFRYAKPRGTFARYGVREFVIGMATEYSEYSAADNQGRRYTRIDPRTVPEVAAVPADANPYVTLAVLAQLDTASTTTCQPADSSDTCYVAWVPVPRIAVSGSLSTRVGHAYASYGVTGLTMKVGVSGGRISMISQDAVLPVVGHGVLGVHWRLQLSGYTAAGTPPRLTAPPGNQVESLD